MPDLNWNNTLAFELQAAPHKWQFSQAMRVLLSDAASHKVTLDLISDPGYRTVDAEIIAASRLGNHWTLSATLPALTGIAGVLPYSYQDTAHKLRVSRDESGLQDFYDIFNQRVLWHSYQATTRNHFSCRYEAGLKPDNHSGKKQSLGEQLCAFAGIATGDERRLIPADHLARYAALLGQSNCSTSLLQQVLEDYFELEIDIVPEDVRKQPLNREFCTALSVWETDTNQLGSGTLLGKSSWLAGGRLDIRIHVASAKQKQRLEQDRQLIPKVSEFCRLMTKGQADFDIHLQCPAELLPQAQLTSKPNPTQSKSAALGQGVGFHHFHNNKKSPLES